MFHLQALQSPLHLWISQALSQSTNLIIVSLSVKIAFVLLYFSMKSKLLCSGGHLYCCAPAFAFAINISNIAFKRYFTTVKGSYVPHGGQCHHCGSAYMNIRKAVRGHQAGCSLMLQYQAILWNSLPGQSCSGFEINCHGSLIYLHWSSKESYK